MVGDYVGETLIVERSNLEKTFWLTFRLHSEIIDVRGEPSVSVSVALFPTENRPASALAAEAGFFSSNLDDKWTIVGP